MKENGVGVGVEGERKRVGDRKRCKDRKAGGDEDLTKSPKQKGD